MPLGVKDVDAEVGSYDRQDMVSGQEQRLTGKEKADLSPRVSDIDRIFLTHYHADHCGLAGRLKEISGARVYLSEADSEALCNQNRTEEMFRRLRIFCREQGFPEDLIDSLQELHLYFTGVTSLIEAEEIEDWLK